MGGFGYQVKAKARELKGLFMKGFKFVEHSCKKGLHKVKRSRK